MKSWIVLAARRVEPGARIADDQRHVVRGVEPADLLHEPVVAEQLAVIRREDHERVVGLAGFVEPIEDAAELVVDLADHPVVGRLELALLLLGRRVT